MGKIHVIESASSPTEAPPLVGVHWINTTTGAAFLSVGTASVGDWASATGADIYARVSGTDSTSGYLNSKITVSSPLVKTVVGSGNETLNLSINTDTAGRPTTAPFDFLKIFPVRYYPLGVQNNTPPTTVVGATDRLDLYPVVWPEAGTIADISVVCTTAVADSFVKIVIYDSDADGLPTDRLFESSEITTAWSGIKTATGVGTSFTKGKVYWVGVRYSHAMTLRATALGAQAIVGGMGISSVENFGCCARRTITFANASTTPFYFSESDIVNGVNNPTIYIRRS